MSASNKPIRSRMAPEQRQALIISAAIDVFSTSAYEATPLARIAKAAGTSEALIHKYFDNKATLYAQALATTYRELRERQKDADHPEHATRERICTGLLVYLDFLAEQPPGWAAILAHPGNEPQPAVEVRTNAIQDYASTIVDMIGGIHLDRDLYAINGFFGFLAVACLRWIEQGCPDDHQHSLIDAALGGLQGALGDWRS